ncbi:hypothetical protein KAR34_07965 [bacterium]|nr:hypothetical protein [bacterium]
MKPEWTEQNEDGLKKAFWEIPWQKPRPGYVEQFRARASQKSSPTRARSWQWVPVAAMGLGFFAGVVLGRFAGSPPEPLSADLVAQEISQAGGLDSGSMALTLIVSPQRSVQHE